MRVITIKGRCTRTSKHNGLEKHNKIGVFILFISRPFSLPSILAHVFWKLFCTRLDSVHSPNLKKSSCSWDKKYNSYSYKKACIDPLEVALWDGTMFILLTMLHVYRGWVNIIYCSKCEKHVVVLIDASGMCWVSWVAWINTMCMTNGRQHELEGNG